MKKLIGILAFAALVASAAFAQVNVGAFGRGFWVPFAWDGEPVPGDDSDNERKAKMGNIAGWSDGGPAVAVTLSGSSDHVGFVMGLKGNSGVIKIDDSAYIWVKPWEWVKITVGQSFDDTLRNSCEFGSSTWVKPSNAHDDDMIFARIDGRTAGAAYDPLKGIVLAITPIDNLYIAAGFNTLTADTPDRNYGVRVLKDVLKNSQYQVGYTIEDLLAIKAQYIGGVVSHDGADVTKNDVFAGTVNAAVELLMIEDHKISLGTYIGFAKKYKDSDEWEDTDAWVNAAYNGVFDALKLNAYLMAHVSDMGSKNGVVSINNGGRTVTVGSVLFGLNIGAGIEYDLGDGMAIEADFRADIETRRYDTTADLSAGLYFSKAFSNGKCGIGVIATVPVGDYSYGEGKTTNIQNFYEHDCLHVAIPIKLQYSF